MHKFVIRQHYIWKISVFIRVFLNLQTIQPTTNILFLCVLCQLVLHNTVLPRTIAPHFITNLAYHQNSRLYRFPPLKIPRYTAKLSYRHPPQVFRHKSRKNNLNSPVSTSHNYLLTAVYWSVIMECQDWSSDTVIDIIVEGRNRWVVLIRIINCIMYLLF